MGESLGTSQNSKGLGLSAGGMRKILQGLYPNDGIISGGRVYGGSGSTYIIPPTIGVTSRGASDGNRLFWIAQTQVTAPAADTTLPRIDVIWLKALDPQMDGDAYEMQAGVTAGTPAQVPVAPATPFGCTRIASMMVYPRTVDFSGTQRYGSQDFVIPYGSSGGLLGEYVDTRPEVNGDNTVRRWSYEYPISIDLPTDRLIELVYDADVSYQGAGENDWMSWAVTFQMENRDIPNTTGETLLMKGVWIHAHNSQIITVERGHHNFRIKNGTASRKGGGHPYFVYGTPKDHPDVSYPGRTFRIWDRGPAR